VRAETRREGETCIVRLQGAWTQSNIARLRRCFHHAALAGKDVSVETSGVTYVDSAFVGLLMLLQGHLRHHGKRLLMPSASDAVRRVLGYCCAEFLDAGSGLLANLELRSEKLRPDGARVIATPLRASAAPPRIWSPVTLPADDRVEVLAAALDIGAAGLRPLSALLSPPEHERAARFIFERDRQRFIVARARLRELLASRLGVAPQAVEFAYGPHGKPVLAGRFASAALRFNLSHSEDLAVYAFAERREVGIDVKGTCPAGCRRGWRVSSRPVRTRRARPPRPAADSSTAGPARRRSSRRW
jgi:anti-anti-sigma regulatory factor